jgi:hypothetical protein
MFQEESTAAGMAPEGSRAPEDESVPEEEREPKRGF